MFGGITESDLDTSSSEDDDDDDDDDSSVSSRPSSPGSPSGFNTPETNHKDGPTQVGFVVHCYIFDGYDSPSKICVWLRMTY